MDHSLLHLGLLRSREWIACGFTVNIPIRHRCRRSRLGDRLGSRCGGGLGCGCRGNLLTAAGTELHAVLKLRAAIGTKLHILSSLSG